MLLEGINVQVQRDNLGYPYYAAVNAWANFTMDEAVKEFNSQINSLKVRHFSQY